MFSGMSYAQSLDTLCYMVSEKTLHEFDYSAGTIINTKTYKEYQDVTIFLNKNQILYLDLYDACRVCNDSIEYRMVNVYYTDGTFQTFTYGEISYKQGLSVTLKYRGSKVKKVVVFSPLEDKAWYNCENCDEID